MTTTDGRGEADSEVKGDNKMSKATNEAAEAIGFWRSDIPDKLPSK
jgi:hypothetical protein